MFVPPPLLVGIEFNPGPAPISKWDRTRIIILKQDAGLSVEKIAEKVNVSTKTVKNVLK